MIKGTLNSNIKSLNLNKNIELGLNWIKENDLKGLADGKFFIEEDKIYANIQTYKTKTEAPFEAHRKYIDIQYIINGQEKIGVTNYSNCTTIEPYDEEKDIEFLSSKTLTEHIVLKEGEFLILYPEDAHQPSLAVTTSQMVRKAVIKVHI